MKLPHVWDESRPRIYEFVCHHLRENDTDHALPDDEIVRKGQKVGWAVGAFDGAFGHHGNTNQVDEARMLLVATSEAVLRADLGSIKRLYDLLIADSIVGCIKPFLLLLSEDPIRTSPGLPLLARWLATEAPDRGPVKFALALLGICGDFRDEDILVALGSHEEFTLYAATAIDELLVDPEPVLFELAKRLHGWGRIHIVERLSSTKNPTIKNWMLREGYKNQIMYEYLAHCCATAGELLPALQLSELDDALMLGAGQIIEALIAGGPAKGIDHYLDGAEAVSLYLEHLCRRRIKNISQFLVVRTIRDFIDDPRANWDAPSRQNWTSAIRQHVADAAHTVLGREEWVELALREIQSEDNHAFWYAAAVLETLGRDPWEERFERQRSGRSDQWYYLMKTDDAERVKRVVALAGERVDLDKIATGPGKEMGMGPGFEQHRILDWILQELPRFPGMGWPLIAAGLRSPVTRNRNMALKVLSAWPRKDWPRDAQALLQLALAEEPHPDVDRRIRAVIDGREYIAGVIRSSGTTH